MIIGAGPAGLRAGQILAEAGRDVLVLERNAEVGPKTCAGGLSVKAVRELEALGLPPDVGVSVRAHGSFTGELPVQLVSDTGCVRTIPRRVLGRYQRAWTERAGAEVRVGTHVTGLRLFERSLDADGRRIRYQHVIGADGSASRVRLALRLPSPRSYFAGEFKLGGVRMPHLEVIYDSAALGHGYFWVFPHGEFTSIGAGGDRRRVPPAVIRPYIEHRLRARGLPGVGAAAYEAATIEVAFVGFDFADGVHLVGDAAGVGSGLTGEGIYSALITGEETARRLLDPRFPSPKTRAWLRMKRRHDWVARCWQYRTPRDVSLAVLARLAPFPPVNRRLASFFLES